MKYVKDLEELKLLSLKQYKQYLATVKESDSLEDKKKAIYSISKGK